MKEYMTLFLDYYDREIVKLIAQKYNYSYMDAFRKFVYSKTYKMLKNIEFEMWEFGHFAIFEMWECEQITDIPQNSSYLRIN